MPGLEGGLEWLYQSLYCVHNLRLAMASERLLQHIDDVTGLQRDGDLLGQYLAAGPIHDGGQIDKPFGHRNIRCIQCPHLVGLVGGEPAQR